MKTKLSFSLILALTFIFGVKMYGQSEPANDNVETVVDKLPKLSNSSRNFNKYIAKHIKYPTNAKLRGVEGDVWVSFIISSTGVVKDVKVDKSVDPVLDEAVVDFVKQTGPWKPGKKDGHEVNTQMMVPVNFTLNKDERFLANKLKEFNILENPPLFVVDNKMVEGYLELEDYNVKSIRVLKGSKATALYGDKGKNGVVVMTTKRGTPPVY
ncbi:energy transducer TonB [Carboxylicivirga linearis]|uniref:TonB family protein n=1 Tax=Carboxylicivirga linearis TaxID=1628157 RepID=A0ABS5K0B4_9BACT|nr:energy transducer TonB [Carboxylicivirga linearis]MBS2100534.1 TonB family protein [Carboxylicivirga linearis]